MRELRYLTGYGPSTRVKKLRVTWTVPGADMAASHEKIFANIPQLTSEKDWLVWKFQVQHALKAAGQWEFITGTANAEAEGYESKKQKAFYSVLQCIGQKYMPMIMSCQTPKDMWDALCQSFERKTVSNKIYTLMQLYGLRMKRGTRIHEHLRQLDELSDHLAAIGEAVSEVHKVAVLLRSVQDSYSTLVTALLARGDDELTLVFVKQALLDEEQRRGRPSDSGSSDMALKSARKFSNKKWKSGSSTCFNCGKPGHFARDCPKQKQKSTKGQHRAKRAEEQEDTNSEEIELFVATVGLRADTQSNDWIVDSGASRHMTFESSVLHDYKDLEAPEPVGLGDGRTVSAVGIGKVKVITQLHNGERVVCWMTDVLYVPKLTNNLFSVNAATAKGNTVSFRHKDCCIRNKNRKVIGTGSSLGKLYKLDCEVQQLSAEKATIAEQPIHSKIDLWHQRLAHVNLRQLCQQVENSKGVEIQSQDKLSFCEACVQGKCHRQPHYPLKASRSKEKLKLVHTDVCGPMRTQSFGGSCYFITFTDDYSRYCRTYFLRRKPEAFEKFKEFKASVENESGMKIKALRADRGGEYLSDEFKSFLKKCGIQPQFTAAYSPQQNGVSERLNRTLVEAARSMLSHAGLSNAYWAEAVATATYLHNRMVSTALKVGETPYLLWYGEKPNLKHVRVFGCVVYTHIPSEQRKKLDKKAHKLRFIGYTETASNYKVWDEEKRKCYIRHDVIFNENDFGKSTNANELELENIEETIAEIPAESEKEESEQEIDEQPEIELSEPLRRSQRVKRPPIHYGIDEFTNTANVTHVT